MHFESASEARLLPRFYIYNAVPLSLSLCSLPSTYSLRLSSRLSVFSSHPCLSFFPSLSFPPPTLPHPPLLLFQFVHFFFYTPHPPFSFDHLFTLCSSTSLRLSRFLFARLRCPLELRRHLWVPIRVRGCSRTRLPRRVSDFVCRSRTLAMPHGEGRNKNSRREFTPLQREKEGETGVKGKRTRQAGFGEDEKGRKGRVLIFWLERRF